MNLSTAIYLTELVDNINKSLTILFALGILAILISIPIYLCAVDADELEISKITKKILKKYWVLILMLVISAPIPSKNAMYLMLGSSYLEQSNIPTKVSQALELKLDDYIKELREIKK